MNNLTYVLGLLGFLLIFIGGVSIMIGGLDKRFLESFLAYGSLALLLAVVSHYTNELASLSVLSPIAMIGLGVLFLVRGKKNLTAMLIGIVLIAVAILFGIMILYQLKLLPIPVI